MHSLNIIRYGNAGPLPQRLPLRAGPLSLSYEDGDLRAIKLGDVEVVRRIYVAVRDRNWGTVLPTYSDVQMDIRADSFRITYSVEHVHNEIDFAWQGEIAGDADGAITCRMDGVARSTFLKNRIGFCVLHPAEVAGAACVVEHIDGRSEAATLPEYIVPDQPVTPFADMQSIRHQVAPGGPWAEVRFEGDVFEMEDQRNWTDASFKTFCTPLRLPYPAEVKAGTKIAQSVRLTVKQEGASTLAHAPAQPRSLTFEALPDVVTRLPDIGLSVASHRQPLTPREMARLQALHLSHLRIDLRLADADYAVRLQQATSEARGLDVPLEVAVLVPPEGDAELRQLERMLDEVKPRITRWLIYPDKELFNGGSLTDQAVRLARAHLSAYDPSAHFASGTNTDFIFMQRTPPPMSTLDMACLSINPQVHAFDNASLMETVPAQATVIRTARRWSDGKPIVVSPVTLKPRFNPYATGAIPQTPPGQLPPQVDARQMSLFGAAWTAGSLKHLSESGVLSVTYYETTGWRGVLETENGSPEPALFHSQPGAVFPLYHVLADVGEFAGGEVVASRSSDPLQVDGLAIRKDGRQRVLVANLTDEAQDVTVSCAANEAQVWLLDEMTAEEAVQSPEVFRQQHGTRQPVKGGAFQLRLKPYAVARVDIL